VPGAEEDDAGARRRRRSARHVRGARGAVALRAGLQDLPHAQREAFLLHEEGGLTAAEIAAVTKSDPEACEESPRYAIAKLKGAATMAEREQDQKSRDATASLARRPPPALDAAIRARRAAPSTCMRPLVPPTGGGAGISGGRRSGDPACPLRDLASRARAARSALRERAGTIALRH